MVHAPLDAAQWESLAATRPELVVLGNARILFGEGEPFVRFVGELRRRLGASPLLWAPRVALPHRMPLLAYLGVDLFDTTEGLARSVRGEFLDAELGHLDETKARKEGRCRCPACLADPPGSLRAHTEWPGFGCSLRPRAQAWLSAPLPSAACAAARRAMGTLNGEHET